MNVNRLRLSLLIAIAVYPVVTALSVALGATLPALPLELRTLLLTGVMVPAMTFVIIPTLLRTFGNWLAKPQARATRSDEEEEYERRLDAWFDEMAHCPN